MSKEQPKYLVYYACHNLIVAHKIQDAISDKTGFVCRIGNLPTLDEPTIDRLKSLYWKIRKNYPLTSWHHPQSPFEQVMQEVLIELGEIIRE